MSKEPTFEQLEARQFFLYPIKTNLPRVVDLALVAFDEWPERWEKACVALQTIGVKWNEEEMELEKAFSNRQNERSAS